ncbi:MAG: HNH endonuclease [Burkholderiales bacterium]|nr:HNH endonuclease [Burkholderiales bacterium]
MKQLERLLFLQGNRCFFCGEPIPEGEASVEHLVATSNGGPKDDDNCVACCKTVNAALGNLSIKAKLQAVLNQRSQFVCPKSASLPLAQSTTSTVQEPLPERVALVVADLQKRGPSRPRRVATLKNTMNSVFQMSLSEVELDALLSSLRESGHVVVEDTKVSYALPAGT